MIGFFEVDAGCKSMGRLISFIGAITGSLMSVSGVIFAFVRDGGDGVALAAVGAGIFTSGAILKGWQKRSENQVVQNEKNMGVPQ